MAILDVRYDTFFCIVFAEIQFISKQISPMRCIINICYLLLLFMILYINVLLS